MAYSDIKDPSAYFYTYAFSKSSGTGSATFDGNSDLQPDFLWVKSRTNADSHELWDSTRGVNSTLFSDNNSAQDTAANRIVSFDTDGFTWGNAGNLNAAGDFVSWAWKANGGTTSSNTDGTITSTVQANTDAGFSIVTYTGNATDNATVGHGLGIAPSVIIIKDLTDGSVWGVWHKDLTDAGYRLTLSTDGGESNDSGFMGGGNRTLPTSSVFSLGGGGGGNGTNAYIAYCFAEKQGYSKFGKYRGNSSTNGTFVYLGFKPRWVMIKSTSAGIGWFMHDTKRSTTNVMDDYLRADNSDGQGTSVTVNIDFLSNGFKLRYGNNTNFSDSDYVYMAFAESPFVAGGIPTTAR